MSLAGKQAVLSAVDWDVEEFEIKGWGQMRIRSFSAKERLELAKQYGEDKLTNEDACDFFCRLIAMAAIDEEGKQVFDLDGDVTALANRNWNRLKEAADRIMSFNGMNEASAKAIEKN